MSSWQRHPLTAFIVVLVFGAYCLYLGMQYSSAEPDEQTTIAHVHEYNSFSRAHCFYHFTVDGIDHSGSDCTRGLREGYFDASVYYDPSKPSINSMNEFGVASRRWYLYGAMDICAGCVIFGVVVFWGAYKKSRIADGGNAAGAGGTVPDPDTVDLELRGSAGDAKPIDTFENELDRSANDDRV